MVISKAMVLNREESSEIDAYNKLLKQYHEAVFFDLSSNNDYIHVTRMYRNSTSTSNRFAIVVCEENCFSTSIA